MLAQFPLRDFLLRLDAAGVRVRVRDYRRIAQALQGSGPWTRRRLRDTLAVLLTKSEHQQDLLFRQFDRYFSGSPARVEAVDEEEIDIQAFTERPAGSGICAGQATGISHSIANPCHARCGTRSTE